MSLAVCHTFEFSTDLITWKGDRRCANTATLRRTLQVSMWRSAFLASSQQQTSEPNAT